jgi:O-antigen/teichoic acid export membrane protein
VWLQKWLVITIVTAFLHNLAAFLLISMRLERLLLFFYLAGLVLNLLWCSLAMPYLPLLGAALAMVLTKGGVALLSVTYAQRRLALIPFRAAAHLGAAIGVGLALYFLTRTLAPRELAEVLALAPALALAASWWRSERR